MAHRLNIRTEGGRTDSLQRAVRIAFTLTPVESKRPTRPYDILAFQCVSFDSNDDQTRWVEWDLDLGFGEYETLESSGIRQYCCFESGTSVCEVSPGQIVPLTSGPSSNETQCGRPKAYKDHVAFKQFSIMTANATDSEQRIALGTRVTQDYANGVKTKFEPIVAYHALERDGRIITPSDLVLQAYLVDDAVYYNGSILLPQDLARPLFPSPLKCDAMPRHSTWRIFQDHNGTVRLENEDQTGDRQDPITIEVLAKSMDDMAIQLRKVRQSLKDSEERLSMFEGMNMKGKEALLPDPTVTVQGDETTMAEGFVAHATEGCGVSRKWVVSAIATAQESIGCRLDGQELVLPVIGPKSRTRVDIEKDIDKMKKLSGGTETARETAHCRPIDMDLLAISSQTQNCIVATEGDHSMEGRPSLHQQSVDNVILQDAVEQPVCQNGDELSSTRTAVAATGSLSNRLTILQFFGGIFQMGILGAGQLIFTKLCGLADLWKVTQLRTEISALAEILARTQSQLAASECKVDELAQVLNGITESYGRDPYLAPKETSEDDSVNRIDELFQDCKLNYKQTYPASTVNFDELDFTGRLEYRPGAEDRGRFADVFRGEVEGSVVAVKVLKLPEYSPYDDDVYKSTLLRFFREMGHWSRLNHPNVARMLGFTLADGKIGLISHWYEHGNLVKYLRRNKEAHKPDIMLDVAEGVQYLHTCSSPLIHGDLKGVNVLVNQHGIALLADFGLSKQVEDMNFRTNFTTFSGIAGTAQWMPPELLRGSSPSLASDIYSLGGVLLEICCPGRVPYYYTTSQEQMTQAKLKGEPPQRLYYPQMADADGLWHVLCACWRDDPVNRPDATVVVKYLYEWFGLSPRVVQDIVARPALICQLCPVHPPTASSVLASASQLVFAGCSIHHVPPSLPDVIEEPKPLDAASLERRINEVNEQLRDRLATAEEQLITRLTTVQATVESRTKRTHEVLLRAQQDISIMHQIAVGGQPPGYRIPPPAELRQPLVEGRRPERTVERRRLELDTSPKMLVSRLGDLSRLTGVSDRPALRHPLPAGP